MLTEVQHRLPALKASNGAEGGCVLQITPLERHALQLVAQGAATTHVCATLGLAAADVDQYLATLFAKFGATSRADAVAAAARRGLLMSSAISLDDVEPVK